MEVLNFGGDLFHDNICLANSEHKIAREIKKLHSI